MNNLDWDRFYIRLAEFVTNNKSKDKSTKVGAIIVDPDGYHQVSTGYNGFCRGIDDTIVCRHNRPLKYKWTEHAERNALYNALRAGVSTRGCYLYLNFSPIPCTDCARGIIQSGITTIIGPNKPFPGKPEIWEEDLKISKEMLLEAGITLRTVEEI